MSRISGPLHRPSHRLRVALLHWRAEHDKVGKETVATRAHKAALRLLGQARDAVRDRIFADARAANGRGGILTLEQVGAVCADALRGDGAVSDATTAERRADEAAMHALAKLHALELAADRWRAEQAYAPHHGPNGRTVR